jgi:hypothetical protein
VVALPARYAGLRVDPPRTDVATVSTDSMGSGAVGCKAPTPSRVRGATGGQAGSRRMPTLSDSAINFL